MTTINQLCSKLINAMGVEDPEIPMTAVKFYKQEEAIEHYRKAPKGDTREKRIDWPG